MIDKEEGNAYSRFPCWRWQVGIGDVDCSLKRCPHHTTEAPGNCDFLDRDRPFTNDEIAAQLDFGVDEFVTPEEVERIFNSAFNTYRRRYLDSISRPEAELLRR